jgi:hypothetical protein
MRARESKTCASRRPILSRTITEVSGQGKVRQDEILLPLFSLKRAEGTTAQTARANIRCRRRACLQVPHIQDSTAQPTTVNTWSQHGVFHATFVFLLVTEGRPRSKFGCVAVPAGPIYSAPFETFSRHQSTSPSPSLFSVNSNITCPSLVALHFTLRTTYDDLAMPHHPSQPSKFWGVGSLSKSS